MMYLFSNWHKIAPSMLIKCKEIAQGNLSFVNNFRKSKTKWCLIKAQHSRVILACYKSLVI